MGTAKDEIFEISRRLSSRKGNNKPWISENTWKLID